MDTTPRTPVRPPSWVAEHARIVADLAEIAAAAGADLIVATAYGYSYGPNTLVGSFQPRTEAEADRLLDAWGCAPLTAAERSEHLAERRVDLVDARINLVWTVGA